jgi:hypothetical protein
MAVHCGVEWRAKRLISQGKDAERPCTELFPESEDERARVAGDARMIA